MSRCLLFNIVLYVGGGGRELLMNACVTAFITVIVTDISAASSEILVFVFFMIWSVNFL